MKQHIAFILDKFDLLVSNWDELIDFLLILLELDVLGWVDLEL